VYIVGTGSKIRPITGVLVGKLDGKVAVITGGTSGMALAGAVEQIGRNVTGVQGDAADLDRLFDTVKREKGAIDVLWASAGTGEQRRLGEIT
jgi:NAD(P)-dependent dehydrogenase (short-subunit alcohol dehydrogenase family)